MSVLLGLELSGNNLILQAVDRRGVVLSVVREQVATSFDEDWRSHPDEKVRSVRALLQHALETGKIRPGSVAAIGVAGSSGLVLVDAETVAHAVVSHPVRKLVMKSGKVVARDGLYIKEAP